MNGAWDGLNCSRCGKPLKLTKFGYVHADTGQAYAEGPDGKDDHHANPKGRNQR